MLRNKKKEISHLKRMLSEIYPYCILKRKKFTGWKVNNKRINLPFKWKNKKIEFENTFKFNTRNLYLKAWFGGESLIYIDNNPVGEFNVFHREFDLTPYCDNSKHTMKIETVPRGLFGTKSDSIFNESYIILYDIELKKAINFVYNIIQIAQETPNEYLSKALIEYTDNFLSSIYIPRDSTEYLKNVLDNSEIITEISSIWTPPNLEYKEKRNNTIVKSQFIKNFKEYKSNIKNLSFPKYGKVYLVGHAHIDYAWLWPIDETKRKIARTFSNVVTLSKKYKDFIFTQSSAKMYKDIKENYSTLYSEIKKLIKEKKWEPIGGMWVEADCNLPSAESLIKQFYYGQKFFKNEFGKKSNICWLPDVFGFSWILPQILKEANIDYFITTKLYWNEVNKFPYDLCRWRGIDGSEVIYYSYKNPEDGFNGKISAKSVINTFENFRHKDLTSEILLTFGHGDGGGGPTEDMCENYYVLKEIPGIPKIKYTTVEEFTKKLPKNNLPVWDGELYLELHRGTFTSQSRTKILHKKCEEKLRELEILNAIYNKNYQKQIDKLWDIVLYNEFHDILPGSSINEVHKKAETELSCVLNTSKKFKNNILTKEKKSTLLLFNPSSFKQKIWFEYDTPLTLEYNGKILDVQKTFDEKYIYYLDEFVFPLETIDLKIKNEFPNFKNKPFENNLIDLTIFEDGSINIFHKNLAKYLFENRGNILMLYKDIPFYGENWDIDPNYKKSGIKLNAKNIKIIEDGHLRKVVQVEYEIEKSKITQYYILLKDSPLVEVKTKIDWHLRRTLLKALFPTNVLSRHAKFDLDIGYIERPTHKNTDFEKARFEVLGHRWVNISQPYFGVSIINDGKYGHNVDNNIIGLSLIKAGTHPDFFADEGIHEFSYAILESSNIKETIQIADNFNKRLIISQKTSTRKFSFKINSENFKILTVKKLKENKIILRIAEVVGTSGKINIDFNNIKKVYLSNILEEIKREIPVKNNKISLEYKPFKIYTFICEM